jgi:archaellum component FlaC
MSVEDQNFLEESDEFAPSFFTRLMRLILRMLVVLVLGIAIGVGAYYGVPALYRATILPMQENTQRIANLELAVEQGEDAAQLQAEQIRDRLTEIEGRQAQHGEQLAAVAAELEHLNEVLEEQSDQKDRLLDMADQLEDLTSDLEDIVSRVETLETLLVDAQLPTENVEYRLQLVRAMTLLARARLWLIEDNLGMAADDVSAVRDSLNEMIEVGSEADVLELTPIVERLDLALEDLRLAPAVAGDELEIAWKLLAAATAPDSAPVEETTIITSEEDTDESR